MSLFNCLFVTNQKTKNNMTPTHTNKNTIYCIKLFVEKLAFIPNSQSVEPILLLGHHSRVSFIFLIGVSTANPPIVPINGIAFNGLLDVRN